MAAEFEGVVQLDVRDSVPDWKPYELPRAPEGAPNVLFVLFDDTGIASWSPYGGRIRMPTMQRLADNGLTFTQWHTTALCSPSRSCFLTGRNHHVNRCAAIMEGTNGFPGAAGRLPAECATIGQVLQDNGFSTFWVGKNHNVPEQDLASGGSRSEWPLQKGFDRFYGFLGGETNNWFPDLVEDNRYIEQPSRPEDGYHLSKDLADQALRMLRDQQSTNPSKPIKPEQTFVSDELTPGKHSLGMEFVRERAGEHHESLGTTTLYVDEDAVAGGPMRAQVGKFTLCGDGLCVGYDSADNVSQQYQNPFPFTGGTILGVGIDVSEETYIDLEREAAGAFARD